MAGRAAHEPSKPDLRFRSRRRAAAALLTGVTLFAGVAAATISRGAFARGPAVTLLGAFGASLGDSADSHFIEIPLDPSVAHRSDLARRGAGPAASFAGGQPVCVRLCDGFYFPVDAAASGGDEAACASLCPDAPTAPYSMPARSDRIEDAISARGERYGALPVALRYRSTRDKTCSCHRGVASDVSPLLDPTLRKGDAVMTERGFAVFQGAERATHLPREFTALSSAGLPKDQRVALQELERANAAPARGVTRSWTLAQGPRWSLRPTPSRIAAATPNPRAGDPERNEIRFVEPPLPAAD